MPENEPGKEEIRRAIEAVRDDGTAARGGRWGKGAAACRHRGAGAPCESHPRPVPLACRPRGRPASVDSSIVVPIVGRVQLAFFAWFEDIKECTALQGRILDLCLFEIAEDPEDTTTDSTGST